MLRRLIPRLLGVAGFLLGVALAGQALLRGPAFAETLPVRAPAPAFDPADTAPTQTATLSGGCFWAMQGVFEHVKGVIRVVAGYTGGAAATARYEIVSTGATGHAESVRITYDPKLLSFGTILQIYVSVAADPTQLNFQGPDSGTQYRSEIWFANPAQQQVAARYIAELGAAHLYPGPIVIRLDPAKPFYAAESYHQDFLVRNPDYPYIAFNDLPKIQALKQIFPRYYRPIPVTVFPAG